MFTEHRTMMLSVLLALLQAVLASMPWDGWSWAVPQAPIEYFFRRHQDMLVKSPDLQCQCPPSKECVVEYKINEDMPDFLKIQGVLNDDKLEELKKYIKDAQRSTTEAPKIGNIRSRRQNDDQECCCPPRSMLMPTFITNKKFDEVTDRLKKKLLSDK
ncbi:uncharacterized protein LOC119191893 [Manduca sexta]|uniref:uncharacterized protein LOC119191893 n=1 Tax=Manduca sexta TaxID=7130 RepID=UPI0011825ECA|nr:uncharacterized protein LOC115448531 isoform X2 [Manduca sexta]XP_037301648.1 uncharacterized protein LOC119191893 [Manduca sexta]